MLVLTDSVQFSYMNERPIAYASRALNPTQQKYSQIEKETLAMVFGCEKYHHFVYGRDFEI